MKKIFSKTPKLINIKNVNRTIIRLSFFTDRKEDDDVNSLIVTRILSMSNKKYKDIMSFNKRKEELSIMDLQVTKTNYNNFELINFTMTIPKKNIIEDLSYDDVFKFLKDVIYYPNTNKEGTMFSKKVFDIEKKYLKAKENDYPHSLREYAYNEFMDFCDSNNEVKGHYKTYIENLKKVTNKSAFEYYEKNILNNDFITYIYGNLDNKDEIMKYYDKYFKSDNKNIIIDAKYTKYLKIKEYKEKTIKTSYNQSVLKLCYQVSNMTKKDVYLFDTLYYFLYSRENDLVYTNLRNVNNLIYTMDMVKSNIHGFLVMTIFCTYSDIDKILNITEKSINQIRDKNNFEIYKQRLLKSISYDILIDKDNPLSVVYNKINGEIENKKSLSYRKKQIEKITFKQMCDFLDRFKLTRKMEILGGYND